MDKKKTIYLKSNSHILFVCYGNVCRSPMAEGLAKKLLGDRLYVESAGFDPVFDHAADNAVKVMRDLFDVDISSHQPRHLLSVSRRDFDHVIVLDSGVYRALQKYKVIPSEKLILWPINDPFTKSLGEYEKCAENLYEHIQNFLM